MNIQNFIPIETPLMTRQRFSELSGLGVEVIRGMIDRGHLPTKKIGRHRLINIAALLMSCQFEEAENV